MLTKVVKKYLVLSAEIGDIFLPEKADNIEESFNLIKKQSILLAEYIKTV